MGLLRYSNSEQTEIVDFREVFDLGDINTILSGMKMLSPCSMEQVPHVGGPMVGSRLKPAGETGETSDTGRAVAWGLPLAMGQGNFGPG